MPKSNKLLWYLLLFIVLTIVALAYNLFFKKQYRPADVAGGSGTYEIFIQPEAGREPVLKALDSAGTEILVEAYLLSDKEIISAIEAAHNRGVKVQIMIEEHPFGGGNINQTTAARLQADDIDFKWTNSTFALTHEKGIIVDRKTVFILNQNLTQSAFKINREFNIIDTNTDEVSEVANIFLADWNRTGYAPQQANLIVSPDNSRGKLVALLNSAAKSLDIEMEVIDDNEVIGILSAKAKETPVRIIIPGPKKVPSNQKAVAKLKSAGVQIKTLANPYIHAKLILVDGARSYTGSVNLTTASLDQNRELGILISQPDIIATEAQTFETDWQTADNF